MNDYIHYIVHSHYVAKFINPVQENVALKNERFK
jgi:hypothetical protein